MADASVDPTRDATFDIVDGRDDTAWIGRVGDLPSVLTYPLDRLRHLGLLRVHWGLSPTSGVPTVFRWERLEPDPEGNSCAAISRGADASWVPIRGTDQSSPIWSDLSAEPTRRSWFVNDDACAVRLVVDRTNGGPPVVREAQAIESASNVASSDESVGEPRGFG
jgi:hypothetical protein